ncbi:MAG: four helix bundle protein [Candidatus Saccharimonadales bacterium]
MTNYQLPKYNLEERSARFGESVIVLCQRLPKTIITQPLITQLVKAATSVGANYGEADDAESARDFRHKIGICKKESRESKHFLRMLAVAVPEKKDELQKLWQEAKELNLILNAIYRKINPK